MQTRKMADNKEIYSTRRRIEPFWYIVIIFAVVMAVLYGNNLLTGRTPNRVALHIGLFNFDVYWYGVLIVGGIALGSYVVARLAQERAQITFANTVPLGFGEDPVTTLELPDEINRKFAKLKVNTLAQLLFAWGLDPRRLGLNENGEQLVREKLNEVNGLEPDWLDDAPWHQWNPDFVWAGVAWCLIFAIIGARLYHILTPSPSMAAVGINSALDYFRNPMQLINIRSGGLGIFGAIVGGAVGLVIYTRRQHISTIAWADLAAVGIPLGQFIGRWANFFNQELYGRPTDLPWAVTIDPAFRLDQYINFDTFHPAFLYASLWNLLTFLILYYLARRRWTSLQTGDLMALYLVLFSIGRILLELVRLDSRTLSLGGIDLGLPVATVVSIIIALPMAALLIYRHVIARESAPAS